MTKFEAGRAKRYLSHKWREVEVYSTGPTLRGKGRAYRVYATDPASGARKHWDTMPAVCRDLLAPITLTSGRKAGRDMGKMTTDALERWPAEFMTRHLQGLYESAVACSPEAGRLCPDVSDALGILLAWTPGAPVPGFRALQRQLRSFV